MNRNASLTSANQSLALTVQAARNRRRANHLRRRATRQVTSAIRETPLCTAWNPQHAQLRHGGCECRVPFARLTDETLELLADQRGRV
jgi:hypothetical protein